jgi:hypothetical protein
VTDGKFKGCYRLEEDERVVYVHDHLVGLRGDVMGVAGRGVGLTRAMVRLDAL